jgi:hypothetical protein
MREFQPVLVKKFGPALHIRYDKIVAEPLPPRWIELMQRIDYALASEKPKSETKPPS